jgi:hypothetical protein
VSAYLRGVGDFTDTVGIVLKSGVALAIGVPSRREATLFSEAIENTVTEFEPSLVGSCTADGHRQNWQAKCSSQRYARWKSLNPSGTSMLFESWAWPADWACGLPLIVLTVLVHVLGLALVRQEALRRWQRTILRGHPNAAFVTVIGCTTLLATTLHGFEVAIWAAAYRFVGALPDNRSAMLYSLNAMTSYGHTNLQLEERWHLMGAIEALNGWLLFGLSTAFLFGIIQRVFSSFDDITEQSRASHS